MIEILKEPIFPYLSEHIKFLKSHRANLGRSDKINRIGINYSIVITTACLIEGTLEYELKMLIAHRMDVLNEIKVEKFYHRRIKNTFIGNVEDLLSYRIERTTGIENFASIFELLSYKRTPAKFSDFPDWEGIRILFNLRNVLAHGREISARRIKAWYLGEDWKDEFKGGYKLTETYLHKKNLIKTKFVKKGTVEHLLTNKVTDHFNSISNKFLKYLSKIFKEEKKKFTFNNINGV